jgi:sensor histidine kinase YesM
MMKSAKEILGFDDRRMMIIGIPLITLLLNAMIFAGALMNDFQVFITRCFIGGLVYTVVYWLAYRQLLLFSRRKFPAPEDFFKRIRFLILMVLVFFFLLKLVLDPIVHPFLDDVVGNKQEHELSVFIASLLVTFLVLGVYETAAFYFQLQKSLLEKERLVKENVQSQLESLKNQVNPHFFFNSLNTLAYLIPEDPAKAETFVQKLSKAYRYILEIRERELATLAEELHFLDAYACLLTERFGGNLRIDVSVPEAFLQKKIVPLSLQMLFENAIKHNVISTQHPLTIEVFVEKGDRLVVRNNLLKKNQDMPSTKVGLQNIMNRYRFVSDREVEVIVTQQHFIVVLPLVEPAAVVAL